jgi:hypothetical protein
LLFEIMDGRDETTMHAERREQADALLRAAPRVAER